MGNVAKSVSAVSGSARARQAGLFTPPVIERGIYRYSRLSGNVYSVYRVTTKKFVGLSQYIDDTFIECTAEDLLKAMHNESKAVKGK